VDGVAPFHGLDFNDDGVGDDEIDAVAAIEPDTAVDKRQRFLTLEGQAALQQVKGEAFLVARFEETRSEFSVDVESNADDAL
jgi:hypothetical protein